MLTQNAFLLVGAADRPDGRYCIVIDGAAHVEHDRDTAPSIGKDVPKVRAIDCGTFLVDQGILSVDCLVYGPWPGTCQWKRL